MAAAPGRLGRRETRGRYRCTSRRLSAHRLGSIGRDDALRRRTDRRCAHASPDPSRAGDLPAVDILTALRILDPLDGWVPSVNRLSRLTQAPKHHLADPAITARLLGLDADGLLTGKAGRVHIPRDNVVLGGLFESLATLSVRVFAQHNEAKVSHLRTYGGEHEVDLIVETGAGTVVAFEVKLSATIDDSDVRHLHWLADQIGDRLLDKAVICTGQRAYRRKDGVAVVPLALLGP